MVDSGQQLRWKSEFLSGRWWGTSASVAEICMAAGAAGVMLAVAGAVVAAAVEIHELQFW